MFKEILKYRDLLWMLTLRDIRIRYKQAAMGFLWAIFMPLIAAFSGIMIRYALAAMTNTPFNKDDIALITVKVVPWTFFVSALKFAVQALVGNSALVTKIYFPRAVLPLSAILACFFDFSIAIGVLVILFGVFQIGINIHFFWIPLIILFLFLFTAGIGILLSAANLFFRDVKYIVEIILMFGIFFTPVLYPASAFGKWQHLMLLNPMGSILESISQIVSFKMMPDLGWLLYAGVASMVTFLIGLAVFHKNEPYFAENI